MINDIIAWSIFYSPVQWEYNKINDSRKFNFQQFKFAFSVQSFNKRSIFLKYHVVDFTDQNIHATFKSSDIFDATWVRWGKKESALNSTKRIYYLKKIYAHIHSISLKIIHSAVVIKQKITSHSLYFVDFLIKTSALESSREHFIIVRI